ncbi:MAG: hypothetical protein US89_C0015G0024 [Candidatus Peregrinibacteria bacterium GW2011_GWF2_38_29]|nr:MAG: hypothetical protein US89_C0015G0024 [Candidatus Peregrinibacteria bacterium GW2011_GWF2_38_29]HBB02716.1 hypothetical protein [Candidatus Peregrinibacteria bacterium]
MEVKPKPFTNDLSGKRVQVPFLDKCFVGDIFYGTNTNTGEIITIQIIDFQGSSVKVRIKTECLELSPGLVDKIIKGARIGFGLDPVEIGIKSKTIEEKDLGEQGFYKLLRHIYTDDFERMSARAGSW